MRVEQNLSALDAFSISQQVTANNVANINTNGFKASEVRLETGPEGEGVRVAQVHQDMSQGPMLHYTDEYGGTVEGSTTEYTTEMVHMIRDENAYAANVASAQAQLDLLGTAIDEMV